MQHRKGMADSCLDDETLAAYVDGGLTAEERTRVERHLASCQDCFAVFTESVKTVQAMQDEGVSDAPAPARIEPSREVAAGVPVTAAPTRRVGQWVAAGAALATAAALVFAVWWPKAERPELVDLVGAVGERRPVEGRLTGGFKFGPIESPTRGAEASSDWRVLAAAAKLEEEARGTENARLLGALGTAHLVTRDFDNAVKYFDQAIDLAPDDSLLRTDRAAALLARGDAAGDGGAADFVRALDDAARAVLKDPTRPEALFNKAIALQRMHLENQEVETWRAYLALDGTSAWADEARRRIAAIEAAQKSRSRWEDHRDAVIAAADRGDRGPVDRAATDFAENIRALVEDEVLPAWGEAVDRGDAVAATAMLARARMLATAVAEINSDPLALEAVKAAELAPAVADGYVAWGKGRRLYAEDRVGEARTEFERARGSLGLDNAVGLAADLYVQISRFVAREYEATGPEFDRIAGAAARRGFWNLLGSAERMRGLVHGYQGEYQDALSRHEASRVCFERSHDRSNNVGAISDIAEMQRHLGSLSEAWSTCRSSLQSLDRVTTRRRYVALTGAALAAVTAQRPGAALAFENAAVQAAKDWDRAGPLVEALQVRARIHLEMGDTGAARADVLTARANVLKVAEPQRARSEAEFAPIEAQLIQGPASVSLLDNGVTFWEGKSPAKLPALLLQRGRALQMAGNARRAAEDYKAGIALIERQRQDVQLEYQRISFLDQSWSLYTALATLELESGRPDLALAAWDRGKARGLLDALDPAPVTNDGFESSLAHSLAPGTLVLCYAVLDNGLQIFAASAQGIRTKASPIGVSQVSRLANDAFIATGLQPWIGLYDSLIRPFESDIRAATHVVVVVDPPLTRVAFAGLRDSSRGTYLVDDVSISYAPSLRVHLALSVRAARTTSPPDSILAIAGAIEKRGTFQSLDQVNREVEHIARLYPTATVVTATKMRTMSLTALPVGDVFHFAGHAIVNDEYPWLSYLLLTNDAVPRRLTMTDIKLSGLGRSRLVVLSACSTAQGRDSRGEGALSLARPFLAAGASAVVATLEPVEDRTMAAIATRFHTALRRIGAAKALREAQIAVYGELRPAQWAAVTVTGA